VRGVVRGDTKRECHAGVQPCTACRLLTPRPAGISSRPLASGKARLGCLPVTYAIAKRYATRDARFRKDCYACRSVKR
jgi:hypothetical protein